MDAKDHLIDYLNFWNGMQKYKVSLDNGKQLTFLAKGNFKANVGDSINYQITNEQYQTAKLLGKAEVKAAVPELAELSDDLVDAILKKGGYDAIGTTLQDTNKLIANFIGSYPELFEKCLKDQKSTEQLSQL